MPLLAGRLLFFVYSDLRELIETQGFAKPGI
jgi:hypothetical protein